MANMNIKPEGPEIAEYDSCPMIYLNDDQVEALGITAPPTPGQVIELRVKATVTRVTTEQVEADEASEGNAPEVYLTLRCGDIELVDSGKSIASSLYGE